MKPLLKPLALALCVAWSAGCSVPARALIADKRAFDKVAVNLNNVSVEGGLLEFARAGNFNFLIDSTNIPANGPRTTLTDNDTFAYELGRYNTQLDIACACRDTGTFLCWHEADADEVMRRVIAGEGYYPEEPPPSSKAIFDLFSKYLERDPKARALLSRPFKIADLPEEMQKPVASFVLSSHTANWPLRQFEQVYSEAGFANGRVWLGNAGKVAPGQAVEAPWWLDIRAPYALPSGRQITLRAVVPTTLSLFSTRPGEPQPPAEAPPSDGTALRLLSSPLPHIGAASGAGLETPVSLEFERKTLRQALDEIEKQSGVRLSTAQAPALDALLLSARTDKMPLFQLLNNLSRLLVVTWNKSGEHEWSADASRRTPFTALLASVGDPYVYRWDEQHGPPEDAIRQAAKETIDHVMQEVDEAKIRSSEGVPFTALPPESRKEILAAQREMIRLGVPAGQAGVQILLQEGVTLQIGWRGHALYIRRDIPNEIPTLAMFEGTLFPDLTPPVPGAPGQLQPPEQRTEQRLEQP